MALPLTKKSQSFQPDLSVLQVAAAVFVFRGTVLTKRSNFAADLDVWRNANRDLYFAARAVKHLRLEMAQLQRQYPGVQWGFFCTGVTCRAPTLRSNHPAPPPISLPHTSNKW